jgi:predicted phosphate transport protein (TIGR00153 family)
MLGSGHIGLRMGRREEKTVIAACEKHIGKIFTIVNRFKTFTDTYCSGDVAAATKLSNEIATLEREADEIKEGIIDSLMKSTLHPMDQDEIMRLILTSDDIAAQLKSATRKMLFSQVAEMPEIIKSGLKQMADTLIMEASALMDTLASLMNNRNDVIQKAEKTERLEEIIDDLRVDLLAQVLDWGETATHIRDWIMIKEAVESIEQSSDKIEDTADVIRAIAILRGRS